MLESAIEKIEKISEAKIYLIIRFTGTNLPFNPAAEEDHGHFADCRLLNKEEVLKRREEK